MSKPKRITPIVILVLLIAAGFAVWWFYLRPKPLTGFASGNGRIEATDVDIATKFYGRISEIYVDEGDMVEAGQTVARMDTKSLEAQLRQAEANIIGANKQRNVAIAMVAQRKSDLNLAKRNLARSERLYENDNIPLEKLDSDRAAYDAAHAMLDAAEADVANAEAAIDAAVADRDRLMTDMEDSSLKTPISGRVQYRLAEPGEVLPAGGKVLTVIDLTDVYMTVFLSTEEAGSLGIGADARIVVDAAPQYAVPAKVTYVASKAQFTPKEVETTDERQKLAFRVKVQIDPEILKEYEPWVKAGLPGVAYVRIDPAAVWPEYLDRFPEMPHEYSK
ncbi:MAG: HlyD family efflux transporter periplasmic adaptor subunit [Thermodesulfobacteriota bacterium]